MAEEKKSASIAKSETKPEASASTSSSKSHPAGQNGKGDGARNIFTEKFRSNFDAIDWSK